MSSKIYALFSFLALFLVVGLISYNELSTSKITVSVRLKAGEDPFKTIKAIVPSDTALVEVKEVSREKNEYQLTVKTRQKSSQLLDHIKRSSRVEKVEEQN